MFDIGRHTVHGNDEKTKILIITKNQDDAMTEANRIKVPYPRAKWDFFKISPSSTEQDTVNLLKMKINEFRPTNLILDFDHGNKPVTLYKKQGDGKSFLVAKSSMLGYLTQELFKAGFFGTKTSNSLSNKGYTSKSFPINDCYYYCDCVHDDANKISSQFMFLHLLNVWSDKTHGAVLMSSLPTTGRGWERELEHIWKTKTTISKTKPFKILVLSGSHGGRNIDGSWNTAISGFTNKDCLEAKFYQEDLKIAAELEKEFKTDNPELTIEVTDIANYNKQLCDETIPAKIMKMVKLPRKNHRERLVDFVDKKRPDLLIIAWCYSTNGDICNELRRNALLSRMIVEAEMRKIGIKDAKLDSDQIEVLKKAQDPNIKDIILTGGTGSGKTILGAEVVKIWMTQQENEPSVSGPCFT